MAQMPIARLLRTAAPLLILVCAGMGVLARADESPRPISLEPGEWLGIDGNWSAFKLQLGTPAQDVNVLVSTFVSELWVVDTLGCDKDETRCIESRGGVFDKSRSSTFSSLGTWSIGLDQLDTHSPANGDYGTDTLVARDPFTGRSYAMPSALLAAVSTTDHFAGLFGLGVTSSSFSGGNATEPPLVQSVSSYGLIPSYSYGYTAGAHYRNTPASLTLGGYDQSRFVPHATEFILSTTELKPYALVRGIEVVAAAAANNNNNKEEGDTPRNWDSATAILSNMTASFNALIDSTTPFLWMPTDVCDRFADAFNLTYNATFDLYTLTPAQYNDMRSARYSFTFSLSSMDNTNDLDDPLNVPGVVNITISSAALASTLQYPFADPAIPYGKPSVPYFPLRRLSKTDVPIIGRAFLQESYIVAEYDRTVYSIHQASFPAEAAGMAGIQPISRPDDSTLPPAAPKDGDAPTAVGGGLSTGHVAAIVVAAAVMGFGILALLFFIQKRRKNKVEAASKHGFNDGASAHTNGPHTPVSRFLSIIGIRRRSQANRDFDEKIEMDPSGTSSAAEVANHEVFEMPAHALPAELEATGVYGVYDTLYSEAGDDPDTNTNTNTNPFEPPISQHSTIKEPRMPLSTHSPAPSSHSLPEVGGKTDMGREATWRPRTARADHAAALSPVSPAFPSQMMRAHPALPPLRCSSSMPISMYNSAYTQSQSASHSPTGCSSGPSPSLSRSSLTDVSFSGATMPESPSLTHTTYLTDFHYRQPPPPPQIPLPKLPPLPLSLPLSLPSSPARATAELPGDYFQFAHFGGSDSACLSAKPRYESNHVDPGFDSNRASVESLGSNFTEMEERMQKEHLAESRTTLDRFGGGMNLRLDLGFQPRGRESIADWRSESASGEGGESPSTGRIEAHDEMVHIPQPAERRYSWED